MKSQYKIVLTSANDSQDCESEHINFDTSLTPANEAILAQVVTDTICKLYEKQGREMLCVWEVDMLGYEAAFYQSSDKPRPAAQA
ncbi:hypothetical protein [Massilia sp. TN1-12]|uniref:hypothetical protein n=1 Tax=Massilia paldalensis TaxID=3377675 RepID=UPI00384A5C78